MSITLSYMKQQRKQTSTTTKDEHLDAKVLLWSEQKVILTSNLWVNAGLVKGTPWKVISIFYTPNSKPPEFPSFVVIDFK